MYCCCAASASAPSISTWCAVSALEAQWLDRVVLQLEPIYADLISRYGRLLRQRSR